MAHIPVNHPAQPAYRVLAGGIGLYVLVFGIVGLAETWGRSAFDRGETWALGLQTNPTFSVLSIVAGAVLFGGAAYGRNLDHFVNLGGGTVFLVAGIVMMTVLRTDANLLNFAMTNCIVSFLIGMALLVAGLYGKVGPPELHDAEERFRHGEISEERFQRSDPATAGSPDGHEVGDDGGR